MSLASLLRPPKRAQLSVLLLESDADVRKVLAPRLHRIRQAPVRIVPALNDLSKARRPDAKLHLDGTCIPHYMYHNLFNALFFSVLKPCAKGSELRVKA